MLKALGAPESCSDWVAAHILPRNYPHFEAMESKVDDPQNGLPMSRAFEHLFDHRKLAFVPLASGGSESVLLVRVEVASDQRHAVVYGVDKNDNLDRSSPLLVNGANLTFADVHNLQISFSGAVPFRRSLVLHHVACYVKHAGKEFTQPDKDVMTLCKKTPYVCLLVAGCADKTIEAFASEQAAIDIDDRVPLESPHERGIPGAANMALMCQGQRCWNPAESQHSSDNKWYCMTCIREWEQKQKRKRRSRGKR